MKHFQRELKVGQLRDAIGTITQDRTKGGNGENHPVVGISLFLLLVPHEETYRLFSLAVMVFCLSIYSGVPCTEPFGTIPHFR